MMEDCKCKACGHEWLRNARRGFPARCPSCRSSTWHTTGAVVHRAVQSPTNWEPKTTLKHGVQKEPRCNGARKDHNFAWEERSTSHKKFFVQVCAECGFIGNFTNRVPKIPKPPTTVEEYKERGTKGSAVRWKDHVLKPKKPRRTPEQISIDARKGAAASNAARAKRKMEALVRGAFYAK